MDRVFESGAAGSAPSAPASPSTGFPTGGNPTSAVPATKPGPYWFHMVTEEIRKVITDAGLTPSHTNLAQLSQAVSLIASAAGLGHGNCYLGLDGANLRLVRQNGVKLIINGAVQTIPAAGVALGPAGLTPSTLYYIYAYMNAGVMTLEASTTGHSTDTTTGVEIKTGDPTRTLVGMAYPIAGPAFVDSGQQRLVASWFNRKPKAAVANIAVNRSTTSATFVELNSADRVSSLVWAGEVTEVGATVSTLSNSAGATWYLAYNVDGGSARNIGYFSGGTAVLLCPMSTVMAESLAEGFHYSTLMGLITGGAQLTIVGGYAQIQSIARA